MPLCLLGLFRPKPFYLTPLVTVALTIAVLSLSVHKEDRFLFPLISMCTLYGGSFVANLLRINGSSETRRPPFWLILLLVVQLSIGIYLSQWHQSSSRELVMAIRSAVSGPMIVSLLQPCHSIPLAANFHDLRDKLTLRTLDCSPQVFTGNEWTTDFCAANHTKLSRAQSPAALFARNPALFLQQHQEEIQTSDWIVMFDQHVAETQQLLAAWGYKVVSRFILLRQKVFEAQNFHQKLRIFHSNFDEFKHTYVYERATTKS